MDELQGLDADQQDLKAALATMKGEIFEMTRREMLSEKHVECLERQSEIQRNHIVTMEQDLTVALTNMKKEIIGKQEAEELHALARKEIEETTASFLRQSQRLVTVQQTAAATEKKGVAEQRVLKEQINSSIRMPETQGEEMDADAKRKGDEWESKLTRSNLLG